MRILKCPHCKSTNITLDTGGQTGKYICKDCKYIGGLVIEKKVNDKKKKRGDSMCFKICARKVSWANWQFGILKLSMLALGILLGAYFAGFWKNILWLVWIVFVVFGAWALITWFESMKKKK